MRKPVAALVLLLASLGCNQKKPVELPPLPKTLVVTSQPSPSMPDGHPALGSLAIASRGPRRLSVTELERSLDQIGNLPLGTVVLPVDTAVTLGRPDYKRLSEEQLEPTPLFMKFMVDLAGFYCDNLAKAEATRPADQKFFTRFPMVEENVRYLVLRFTGIEGTDADGYVTRLMATYTDGSQGSVTLAGYQAVCMSLFTSPEFLLY